MTVQVWDMPLDVHIRSRSHSGVKDDPGSHLRQQNAAPNDLDALRGTCVRVCQRVGGSVGRSGVNCRDEVELLPLTQAALQVFAFNVWLNSIGH